MKYALALIPILALAACQQRSINGDDIVNGTADGAAGTDNSVYDEYGQLVSVNQSSNAAGFQTGNTIRLADYSQAQQKIDREEYARELDAVEANRVEINNVTVPTVDTSINVAAYARSTTNQLGQSVYSRGVSLGSGCGSYASGDAAQRAFLANGGPASDPKGLDKDGDGFACSFDPSVYRSINF